MAGSPFSALENCNFESRLRILIMAPSPHIAQLGFLGGGHDVNHSFTGANICTETFTGNNMANAHIYTEKLQAGCFSTNQTKGGGVHSSN